MSNPTQPAPPATLMPLSSVAARTHCDCGTALEPAAEAGPHWGQWKCGRCGWAYCQDCGSSLDYNSECIAYREAEDAGCA